MHTILGLVQIGGGRVMDEVEVDAELTARRKAQPGFIEASFPTIAGLWVSPSKKILPYEAFSCCLVSRTAIFPSFGRFFLIGSIILHQYFSAELQRLDTQIHSNPTP